ncbi:MAG: fumarylacetoacetate hydrolase family protein [Terriglobia bacterium]|jgi:2-keto-4-pentenoate hydratase/2-oxohepta-3-ene-1,7-dioic acid hydratase in catechol pathway|nr:fumarylacetoacetate hydrolase family protein [Terriglobia bacterium]
MRLVQFRVKGRSRLGLVVDGRIVDVASAAAKRGYDIAPFHSTLALLEAGPVASDFVRELGYDNQALLLTEAELDYPVAARKIVAIGLNYLDHAKEAGQAVPTTPLCFAKFTSSLSGPYDPIQLPAEDAQVDFEGELGVVIGRTAHFISEADAMECIAGYVVFNDVSARKWQFADGQWTRGKSCDTFSPNGPCLVTRDEVPDPGNLRVTTRVNGELMQDSSTKQLIFNIPQLISYLSKSFSFHPGDIIATGTPPGVGFSRNPPRFLHEGDVVEVEIEGVGKIANRVVRGY